MLTAYHEGGHAFVALTVPATYPVHKATIIPRGRALGMVMQLPEGDRYSMRFQQMTSRLTILMGGRVAEEIVFGHDNITSGASSDNAQATKLAKAKAPRWGYSEALGLVAYGDNQDEVFLGHSVTQNKNVAAQTIREIDGEIKAIIDQAYINAKTLLTERIDDLHSLANGLLEYETLSGDEIRQVLRGEPVERKVIDEPMQDRRTSVPTTVKPVPPSGGGLDPAPQPG